MYTTQYQRKHNNTYTQDAVRAGLHLIMTLNIFTLGELTFKQLNCTAMGTPSAPLYTTIYYGIHEEKFLPQHSRRVIYYRRFIDDVIGIWCPNKDPQLGKYLTLKILWNSKINSMSYTSQQTLDYSLPTPCPCIPTSQHTALNLIGKYLTQYQWKHNNTYPHDAVRAGLRLIMTLNIFTFGDLTFKQLNGTAMGTPPAHDILRNTRRKIPSSTLTTGHLL